MTQPSHASISIAGVVRPTAPTATAEIGRAPKPGLQRRVPRTPLAGTPAPGEGYALTIAERECASLVLPAGAEHHDVVLGVALVAAKRASRARRGPTVYDVRAVIKHFDLEGGDPTVFTPFAGLAHSYAAQRNFVDAAG